MQRVCISVRVYFFGCASASASKNKSQMLIAVRVGPFEPTSGQTPPAKDETMVHHVDQVVVNLHHPGVQWCLQPLQCNALNELPSLFRVKEMIVYGNHEVDVKTDPGGKKSYWGLYVVVTEGL